MLTVAGKGLIISETFDVKTRCTKCPILKVEIKPFPNLVLVA